MKCTDGWELVNRLVTYGFKIGPFLSPGVFVQCAKIVIPRIFQTADGAVLFATLSCVCKSLDFFICAVPCEIGDCWVRSVSHDVYGNANAHATNSLSVGVSAGFVTSAVIL
jgi:hypothetical protein